MKNAIMPLAVVLLVPLFLVAVTSSLEYDPWSDLDASGDIDIFDVVTVAGAYRTTGDPTKSVYVLNWPVTTQQTVFYGATFDESSGWYNASGFGHVHLIWYVENLADSETVTVQIWVRIYGPEIGTHLSTVIQSQDVTTANYRGALSFPVPAETFRFSVDFASGTTASVDLAFYLTYA